MDSKQCETMNKKKEKALKQLKYHSAKFKSKDEKEVLKQCKNAYKEIGGFFIEKKGQYYYGFALPDDYQFLDNEEEWWPKESKAYTSVTRNYQTRWYELTKDDLKYKRFLIRENTLKKERKYWNKRIAMNEYDGRKIKYKPTERTLKKWSEIVNKSIEKKQKNK